VDAGDDELEDEGMRTRNHGRLWRHHFTGKEILDPCMTTDHPLRERGPSRYPRVVTPVV
jgi:hypothetical protein